MHTFVSSPLPPMLLHTHRLCAWPARSPLRPTHVQGSLHHTKATLTFTLHRHHTSLSSHPPGTGPGGGSAGARAHLTPAVIIKEVSTSYFYFLKGISFAYLYEDVSCFILTVVSWSLKDIYLKELQRKGEPEADRERGRRKGEGDWGRARGGGSNLPPAGSLLRWPPSQAGQGQEPGLL